MRPQWSIVVLVALLSMLLAMGAPSPKGGDGGGGGGGGESEGGGGSNRGPGGGGGNNSGPSNGGGGAATSTPAPATSTPAPAAPTAPPATAGGGGGSTTGLFIVTLNGQVFGGVSGVETRIRDSRAVTGTINVRGVHTSFDVNSATFEVTNFLLTGAPDPARMVTSPTTVFASKSPILTASQLANPVLSELRIDTDKLVLQLGFGPGAITTLKIQANDAADGGVFQFEPDGFTTNVNFTHVLAPGMFYFINEFTNQTNIGNGVDAVTTGPANMQHAMFLGKDSPQAAGRLTQDGMTSSWTVQAGGRMGAVFGEDVMELGPGAGDCTHQCQIQDMIHGSLPVTPNPTIENPLPGAETG